FAHDSGIRTKEAPAPMLVAMTIAAAICIFNGVYPWLLYDLLPYSVAYEPYTWAHIVTQCQLLFFSALAFTWLKLSGLYPPELASTNLYAEWIYRRLLPRAVRSVRHVWAAAMLPVSLAVQQGVERGNAVLLDLFGRRGVL